MTLGPTLCHGAWSNHLSLAKFDKRPCAVASVADVTAILKEEFRRRNLELERPGVRYEMPSLVASLISRGILKPVE